MSSDAIRPPLIVARHVERTFVVGDVKTRVLHGLSLTLPRGVFASVVGKSGCGKSTLLSLLGALDKPDAGSLVVDGVDLMTIDADARNRYRRQKIGFVFQFYNLLPSLTALENVESSLEFLPLDRPARRKRAADYLARVGLADVGGRFPAQLSGGMQQRVALARALAREPVLLLADEPTGNLDHETGVQVFECIRDLVASLGVSCVMVTHDPALAARTDLRIAMHDGRIVEGGEAPAVPAKAAS